MCMLLIRGIFGFMKPEQMNLNLYDGGGKKACDSNQGKHGDDGCMIVVDDMRSALELQAIYITVSNFS